MIMQRKSTRRRASRTSTLGRKYHLFLEEFERRQLLTGTGFLQGTAYVDNNSNGMFDKGDAPLIGAQITVTLNGNFVASKFTSTNGTYTFTDLAPGTYQIVETPPTGATSTSAQANWSIGNSEVVDSKTITAQVIDTSNVFVNWIGPGAHSTIGVVVQGHYLTSPVQVQANVGELDGTLGTQPGLNDISAFVAAYCVDLYGDFDGGDTGFQVTPTDSNQLEGNSAAIAYLLNEYQQSIATEFANATTPADIARANTKGTALQLAIWQLEYEPVPDLTLGLYTDKLRLADPGPYPEVVAQTDFYLLDAASAVASGFAQNEKAVFLRAGNADVFQSLIASGSLDFGNSQSSTASISGLKFQDLTGDGIYTPGAEPGIAGVTISLYQAGGLLPIATTTTGNDGSYSFGNLTPGTYWVQEGILSGWTQTVGIGGYTVNLQAGQNVKNDNFADFQNVSISGTKFNDLTGNSFSADDKALGGVTVNLYLNGSPTPFATTVTASITGTYSFTNLGPGAYSVQEVVPDAWTQTGGVGGYSFVAQSGQDVTNQNFDDFGDPAISGYKFNDVNANGKWDSSELGVAGITIALYTNTNGTLTPFSISGTPVTTVTSNGTNGPLGFYSFDHLPPLPAGTSYAVREVVPTGFAQTTPNPADIAATSGNKVTNANFGDVVIATCACNLTGVSYKVTPPGGSSTVVNDLRGNTQQGSTVTVTFTVPAGQYDQLSLVSYTAPESFYSAYTASSQVLYQQTTGVFGPGVHTMTVTLPNSFYQVDFVCGSVIAQLGPAGSNNFYGAQNRLISADNGGLNPVGQAPLSITGTVFADQNNDGLQGTGDAGLGGVTVTLTGTDAYGLSITQSAVTNAQGQYTLTGMPVSNGSGYTVAVSTPSGDWTGKATVGTAGGTLSSTAGVVKGTVLGSGKTSSANENFAVLLPTTIAGTAYSDVLNTGVLASVDKVLSGVKITLTGTNDLGASVSLTTTTNSSGNYSFTGLRAGNYTLTETVPTSYTAGKNSIGQINGTTATGATVSSTPDLIGGVAIQYGASGTGFNFANLYNSGSSVAAGQAATIGFWANKNGQALINSFAGASTSTSLAQWLTTAFPNLYANALSTTVLGQVKYSTNAQVAAYYLTLFNVSGTKTMAQLFSAALGVYASTQSLGGTAGAKYGFTVSANGLGVSTYNVGSNGQAFGVSNNVTLTVFQLLNSLNSQASNGSLFASASNKSTLLTQANTVLSGINQKGDI